MRTLLLVLALGFSLVACSGEPVDGDGQDGSVVAADGSVSGGPDASSGPRDAGAGSGHQETKTLPGATGSEPGGLIPVCCAPSAEEAAAHQEVFRLLNAHRQANGKAALTYDATLESAILAHCHHMATHDFLEHDAPEAAVTSPWERAKLCGTNANAENIAWGQSSPQAVMTSWKNSAGHNANMLGDYKRVGVGRFRGAQGLYWGQLFGK
jgi:uncharacterized protein YkwD